MEDRFGSYFPALHARVFEVVRTWMIEAHQVRGFVNEGSGNLFIAERPSVLRDVNQLIRKCCVSCAFVRVVS